jgi:hypothetical protein
MTLPMRRVVTGHGADGKAVMVADGEAPRSWRRPSGLRSRRCWVTDAMPIGNVGLSGGGDQDIGIPPPSHGSVTSDSLQARSGACRDGQRRVGGVSAWPSGEEGVIC